MYYIFKLIWLVIISLTPFLFTINGDFVFDDSEAILKNKDLNLSEPLWKIFQRDFWGTNIKSQTSHKSYRPLTILTFRLNKQLNGDTFVSYNFKLTNTILHVLATLFLYQFIGSIYKYQNIYNNSCETWQDIPYLSSILFAVHPVHVEAVSGIVGRADVLSAIFFLLALYFYDKCIIKKRNNPKQLFIRILFFSITVLCAIFATLSKETGITVLCVCSIYDIMIVHKHEFISFVKYFMKRLRKNVGQNPSEQKNGKNLNLLIKDNISLFIRQVLLFTSALIILYGRWAVMNYESPSFQNIDNPAAFNESRFIRIFTYNYIYFINMLILFWPQWLCFDWSMGCIPVIHGICDLRIIFVLLLWSFLSLLLMKVFLYWSVDSQKCVQLMALCLIIIPFLPASNIFLPVGFVIAERILYIPSMGFCLLIAIGLNNLLTRTKPNYHKAIKISFIILICIMMLRSYQRSKDWLTEKSLYSSGLEVCPLNAKVHYNIAKNAGDSENMSLAEIGYKEAIKLNPTYYQAMNNLANLLKDQNRFIEAEIHLRNALKIKMDFPAAWMNLGIVLAALKRPIESEQAYKEALKYRKNYADCYYNLGNLYLDQKDAEMALESWSTATKINSKHAVAWSNIFALLDNSEQIDKAFELIPKVLSVLPNVPAIHFNIANILGKKKNFVDAEKHFKEAIFLKKKNIPAVYYANLGVLYHRWKKPELAIKMYKKALKINPLLQSAKENMKKLIKSK